MPFNIIWDEKAFDQLNKLESVISKRIVKKIKELGESYPSGDIKKLKGQEGYRLRIGDYKAVFDIELDKIIILKVGHRKHIYD
ncbi:MAG: type II toxin-antitoxin system RelE/ParE family toxin [Candidatus Nanoarchaeia archaeon]|nr:type II toxin-antitoxin system RelE/ParE family toxin [Candidatus Nanoarchaeia archaeon]